MTERHFALPAGGAYTLTDSTVKVLLDLGSGDVVRVYLYLLRQNGSCADKTICDALGMSAPALGQALSALQKEGLLAERASPFRPPSDIRPDYTGREVAAHIEGDPAFRHLTEETQRRLGRILSANDLQVLYGLYDWRGFSPGMISLLVSYCLEDTERRFGQGRKPTLTQIDKQAAVWERDGVNSEEKAEQYILEKEAARQTFHLIAQTLGITGRSPSPTEKRYLSEWAELGLPMDVVALAYDKTVVNTGRLTWKYMDSILRNWKDNGLLTLADIESSSVVRPANGARPVALPRAVRPGRVTTPDARDRQAMEKMKRFVEIE